MVALLQNSPYVGGISVRMRWQGKWCVSFFFCCWHPSQWLFPKRMEKKLDDGRGGPWGDRVSNTFQLLSLNKWVIGWAHRAPPSSQPGPLALVLWQPLNPTAEADTLSCSMDRERITEGICLIWHAWSPGTKRGVLLWGNRSGSKLLPDP